MRLSREAIEQLKSAVTHNVAQNLLAGDKEGANHYMSEFSQLLQNLEVDQDIITEIMTYAKMKARREVKTIIRMNEEYGLNLHVSGNAGSQIKPEVYLEQFFALFGKE